MLSSIMDESSSILVFVFTSILIHFLALSTAQQNYDEQNYDETICPNNTEPYRIGSDYHFNLLESLSSITANSTVNYGFYRNSVGNDSHIARAVALCRGDDTVDYCRKCILFVTWKILQRCPSKKEAVGWHRRCMVRYSQRPIFEVMETQPFSNMSNGENVTESVNEFRRGRQELLSDLKRKAASGDWRRKFETGNKTTMGKQRIYGLVQCTPDLSEQDCNDCLDDVINRLPQCCDNQTEARLANPSCNLWFSMKRFFDSTPDLPSLPKGNRYKRSQKVIIIAAGSASSVSLILITCIYLSFICLRTKKNVEEIQDVDQEDEIMSVEFLQFDFSTIMVATDSFSVANKLGEGGFGPVYKGKLSNGKEIAVKRLSKQSRQGDREFKNEVFLVAKLQHRNLVRLLGFCLESNERLLIYEFVPNSSLDRFIFDPSRHHTLDWEGRYKIIRGIARGLLYLHEDSHIRIVHRDLKASNILLDSDMNPKISDFGLARLFKPDNTQGNTSRVVGTFGYMAPEYLKRGLFSTKSDVFSFGVLVLEIVVGQHNSCFGKTEEDSDLLTYAWESWMEGEALKLIDPTMQANSTSEILRCIHIGLLCVQENVADRPTMSSILVMLSSCSIDLPVPLKPAFFMHNTGLTRSAESNAIFAQAYTNEVTITELGPR